MCSAMGEVLTGTRVRAEGIGITSKTSVTCFLLWFDSRRGPRSSEFALLAFAIGQLAYGVSVLAAYFAHFRAVHWWRARIPTTCVNIFLTSSLGKAHDLSAESALESSLCYTNHLIVKSCDCS